MTDAPLRWRKSTYSSSSSSCVEAARYDRSVVLLRNSNHPDAGTLTLSPAELGDWIAACKAGDLDDLTG